MRQHAVGRFPLALEAATPRTLDGGWGMEMVFGADHRSLTRRRSVSHC